MRVTSNLFPTSLKDQLNTLQQEQYRLQNQVATGLKFQRPSEDPVNFAAAQAAGTAQAAARSYQKSNDKATDVTRQNHAAMTDLQRILNRTSELAIRAGGVLAAPELRIIGQEMQALLDQVVGVANRQDGQDYLFGSTGNVPPVVRVGTGEPPVYAYNTDPVYTANTAKMEIQSQNTVETGLVAGRAGTGGFEGFLNAGGVDVLQTLTNMRDALLSGNPVDTSGTDYQNLTRALGTASEYVGKTSARLSLLSLNETNLRTQLQDGAVRLADVTQVSLTDAVADLNRVQFNYQAAMQSGARILQISLMDYLR